MPKSPPDDFKITDPAEMAVTGLPPLDRHPGVYFRETLMPQWGLKVLPLSKLLGVNRANLHDVLQGKTDVSREMAYRIGALLGDGIADLLINYQLQWDLQNEADRRAQLRREIDRLPPPTA